MLLRARNDISTKGIRERYGTVAAAKRKAQEDATVKEELDENTRLKNTTTASLRES
jgi:Asp-tRNA(Asn)/Glu-tRNA(Gln) amidotransferase A subunit family amidase